MNNSVCYLIEFIKDLAIEEYGEKISYLISEVDTYFKSGGCYELVKILRYFLPNSQIYVSNDFDHCAFFYKGILYDIDGVIENFESFHLATPIDLNYLNDEALFGRCEIKFDGKKPSEALIEQLKQCRIEKIIEKCLNMDYNPYYSNKTLKQKVIGMPKT